MVSNSAKNSAAQPSGPTRTRRRAAAPARPDLLSSKASVTKVSQKCHKPQLVKAGRRLASVAPVRFRPRPPQCPHGRDRTFELSRGIAWRTSAETDGEIATPTEQAPSPGGSLKGGPSPCATRFTQLQGLIGKYRQVGGSGVLCPPSLPRAATVLPPQHGRVLAEGSLKWAVFGTAMILRVPLGTRPSHVMKLGPIGIAGDLDQPVPPRNDPIQALETRRRRGLRSMRSNASCICAFAAHVTLRFAVSGTYRRTEFSRHGFLQLFCG
jgi:hypothetical protein